MLDTKLHYATFFVLIVVYTYILAVLVILLEGYVKKFTMFFSLVQDDFKLSYLLQKKKKISFLGNLRFSQYIFQNIPGWKHVCTNIAM